MGVVKMGFNSKTQMKSLSLRTDMWILLSMISRPIAMELQLRTSSWETLMGGRESMVVSSKLKGQSNTLFPVLTMTLMCSNSMVASLLIQVLKPIPQMLQETEFKQIESSTTTIEMDLAQVRDFYAIPAQSAGLYPKTSYKQRLVLLDTLLEHIRGKGHTSLEQRWGWCAARK